MAIVEVVGEVLSKSLDKCLVVLGGVEFFRPEKVGVTVFPAALQHLDVEQRLEFGGDIL